MKVMQNGKEVKNASVVFDGSGNAVHVTQDGVNYDVSAFDLVEDKDQKKTKEAPESKAKTSGNGEAMTTEDVSPSKPKGTVKK